MALLSAHDCDVDQSVVVCHGDEDWGLHANELAEQGFGFVRRDYDCRA
jgi:hypothetical protein